MISSRRLIRAIRSSRLKAEILPALGAAALATALGVWALQLWKANLRVPFEIGSDAGYSLIMIKDVITHGWDLTDSSLGAPFGLELYDYPAYSGDSLYLLVIKALGIFSEDPAVVVNGFFLLCFPLIAITAFGALRWLGISTGVAVVCAILYDLLPYRLGSFEFHLFLSSYFMIPICCCLILATFNATELFVRDPRRTGVRAYLTYRALAMGILCLLIGSADNYFAVFTVALMLPAALFAYLANRRLRALACALIATAIVLAAISLNALPTIIYHLQHGPDNIPTQRRPQETDTWGLSLTNLVLPIEGSRIPLLTGITHRYNETIRTPLSLPPASEPGWTSLGLVGTLGFLWLTVTLVVHCLRRGGRRVDSRGVRAALAAALAFLIGTVGGLATLFAYAVTPQMHAPGRIIVFIAFFALFGAALGLDQLRGRIRLHPSVRRGWPALLAAVLVVGVLSETSPLLVPDYTAEIAQYNERKQFARAIEFQVPAGSSIFELPYLPFPQGVNPPGISLYEDLYVYLVSRDLRWSGGAMEGRPTDWVPSFVKHRPITQILAGISAVGFRGLYVEPAAYADADTLLRSVSRTLGVAPLISPSGRMVFFNMEKYNRGLRMRYSAQTIAAAAEAILHPSAK
jgi:hypothetical protein